MPKGINIGRIRSEVKKGANTDGYLGTYPDLETLLLEYPESKGKKLKKGKEKCDENSWAYVGKGSNYDTYKFNDGGKWKKISSSSVNGVPEAPVDGKLYGRQLAKWAELASMTDDRNKGYFTSEEELNMAYPPTSPDLKGGEFAFVDDPDIGIYLYEYTPLRKKWAPDTTPIYISKEEVESGVFAKSYMTLNPIIGDIRLKKNGHKVDFEAWNGEKFAFITSVGSVTTDTFNMTSNEYGSMVGINDISKDGVYDSIFRRSVYGENGAPLIGNELGSFNREMILAVDSIDGLSVAYKSGKVSVNVETSASNKLGVGVYLKKFTSPHNVNFDTAVFKTSKTTRARMSIKDMEADIVVYESQSIWEALDSNGELIFDVATKETVGEVNAKFPKLGFIVSSRDYEITMQVYEGEMFGSKDFMTFEIVGTDWIKELIATQDWAVSEDELIKAFIRNNYADKKYVDEQYDIVKSYADSKDEEILNYCIDSFIEKGDPTIPLKTYVDEQDNIDRKYTTTKYFEALTEADKKDAIVKTFATDADSVLKTWTTKGFTDAKKYVVDEDAKLRVYVDEKSTSNKAYSDTQDNMVKNYAEAQDKVLKKFVTDNMPTKTDMNTAIQTTREDFTSADNEIKTSITTTLSDSKFYTDAQCLLVKESSDNNAISGKQYTDERDSMIIESFKTVSRDMQTQIDNKATIGDVVKFEKVISKEVETDKINFIPVDEFYRRFGYCVPTDLTLHCADATGMYRVFNAHEGIPPDGIPGDCDYFVESYVAEEGAWIRLQIYNVRNSNMWEKMCIGGRWREFQLIPNADQISNRIGEKVGTELDRKVDKEDGMSLSHNDFTDGYKTKLERMENKFKGVFDKEIEIRNIPNSVRGDYAVLRGEPSFVFFFDGTDWVNSNASLGGDMLSTLYDPEQRHKNIYDRRNHFGFIQIPDVEGLEKTLDQKLNVSDKTKVVDNFESDSPTDALSANCGGYLRDKLIDISIGKEPIEYGSLKEENGYTTLSNGMIIQWGTKDLGSSTAVVEVTFPIPFKNRCLNISVTPKASTYSGSGSNSCYGNIIDKTKFCAVMDYKNKSVTTSCWWYAIGF